MHTHTLTPKHKHTHKHTKSLFPPPTYNVKAPSQVNQKDPQIHNESSAQAICGQPARTQRRAKKWPAFQLQSSSGPLFYKKNSTKNRQLTQTKRKRTTETHRLPCINRYIHRIIRDPHIHTYLTKGIRTALARDSNHLK